MAISLKVQALVDRVVAVVPGLATVYQEHLVDYDGLLPHVFFGDVCRRLADLAQTGDERPLILAVHEMDEALKSGDQDVTDLIGASFVENLEDDEDVWSIVARCGSAELRRLSILH